MVSFPYSSHTFRDSYGSGMGIVWGPRGPMSLGVPENPTESTIDVGLPIGAEAGQKTSAAFLHRVQLGINGSLLRSLVGWKKVISYSQ